MSEWLESKEGEQKGRPEPSKCPHIRAGEKKNQGWTFGVCVSESKSIGLTIVPLPTSLPLVLCIPAGTTPRVFCLFSPRIVHCHYVFVFQLNEEGFAGPSWCNHLWWENWAQALSHKTHRKCLPESLPPPLCCSLWSLSVSYSDFKKLAHVVAYPRVQSF